MSALFVVVFPIEGLISPPRMRRMAMDQIGPMLVKQRITLSEGRWYWRVEFDGRDRYLVAQHAAESFAPGVLVERRARELAEAVRGPLPRVAQFIESSIAAAADGEVGEEPAPKPRMCSVDGCDAQLYVKGMCSRHYARARAHGGDPTAGRMPVGEAPARLDELEHLLDQGVDREQAILRCGWKSRSAALGAAKREGRSRLASALRRSDLVGVAS